MLISMSLKNIKNSLRDYSIYFFTLVIGVMVFYSFNAIVGSKAYTEVSNNYGDMAVALKSSLAGVSVFVSIVLGMLIVYASRFLMKRRNKEFALYMVLGMEKKQVSGMLFVETLIIGAASLVIGLALGIGISQLMGVFVMKLFDMDMSGYGFSVSQEAIRHTIVCFAIMYVIVMIFNGTSVSRMKLIDLISSGKKSEEIKMKNPAICVLVFLISAAILGGCYYKVGWKALEVEFVDLFMYILLGVLGTFLLFWSVSGMILRVLMLMKRKYYKGLNSFTFRQLSSKVNTVVVSMTIICVMLFFTISMLSTAFSIRTDMDLMIEKCRADCEIRNHIPASDEKETVTFEDVEDVYSENGFELATYFKDYLHYHFYSDSSLKLGGADAESMNGLHFMAMSTPFDIMKLSDYNRLMEYYGREKLELGDDEYIIVCNVDNNVKIFNECLKKDKSAVVFGHSLISGMDTVKKAGRDFSGSNNNVGVFVVPDMIVDEGRASDDCFVGNYAAESEEGKKAIEKKCFEATKAVEKTQDAYVISMNTKSDLIEGTVGTGALVTIIGLYLGIIFLIASGAVLALRELSDSVDSVARYEMLRKIGVDEREISRSLFRQTKIFFLLPLLIAAIHSFFGIKYTSVYVRIIGTEGMFWSILVTICVILLIYGGYFAVSYFGSKRIIRGQA